MSPAEWIRKFERTWGRWPRLKEVLFEFPTADRKQLEIEYRRVIGK